MVFDEAKGKLKELAGDVTGDPELQRKGQAQVDQAADQAAEPDDADQPEDAPEPTE